MNKYIVNLLVFVALLMGLNFLFKEMDYGLHISIVGSVVITLVIWAVMGMGRGSKGS
jgi:hypothetical protein